MSDFFESDSYFFNNDIFYLIEAKSKQEILILLREKHLKELQEGLAVIDKKNDLLIWNAMYTREIVKSGVSKKYLHPLYNKFYKVIQGPNDLMELQGLEIRMVEAYLDILINDIEVTDNYMINKILQYLHMHIESSFSLEDLARDLNISTGYASDCFKRHTRITVMAYAKKIKIERAKMLLSSTDMSILDMGLLLGFYDQSHFSRTFKAQTGMSPTEFRNKKTSCNL